MSGVENLLKTGIVAAPEGSNILHEQASGPSKALPAATLKIYLIFHKVPLMSSTALKEQDKGGLLYLPDELLYVLEERMFTNCALQERPNLQRPLASLLSVAVPALVESAVLQYIMGDDQHRQDLAELVRPRFTKPILRSYS
ncbi:hypothetical protein HPB52_006484 [Rhipicephalus sanguineus]|uniref:Uncharacterized protein n=1 Tax=Rhipicephalus sanguineus TaxID=34632 RepID=A0A9D4PUU4_RHISA|nr:hypothetical protein HPB52_006484 [Rhipicephalus sanguineus]